MQKIELENKRLKQEIEHFRAKYYSGETLKISSEAQTDKVVSRKGLSVNRANSESNDFTVVERETQTYEEYLLPSN